MQTSVKQPRTHTVAWTGASGLAYGLRLVECLLQAGENVYLLYSPVTQIVAQQELFFKLPSRAKEAQSLLAERWGVSSPQLQVFGKDEWFAPVASGSNPADTMTICPCTMGTLAAIAHGISDNLIERAADVMLKERRPLVLVPRETPFSSIHLSNMLQLSQAGACILPPNPAFYHHPTTVDDLIDFVVARILDQLQVPHQLMLRWGASAL